MKRVLLLPNPYKDPGLAVSGRIAEILSSHGTEAQSIEIAENSVGITSASPTAGSAVIGTLSIYARFTVSLSRRVPS